MPKHTRSSGGPPPATNLWTPHSLRSSKKKSANVTPAAVKPSKAKSGKKKPTQKKTTEKKVAPAAAADKPATVNKPAASKPVVHEPMAVEESTTDDSLAADEGHNHESLLSWYKLRWRLAMSSRSSLIRRVRHWRKRSLELEHDLQQQSTLQPSLPPSTETKTAETQTAPVPASSSSSSPVPPDPTTVHEQLKTEFKSLIAVHQQQRAEFQKLQDELAETKRSNAEQAALLANAKNSVFGSQQAAPSETTQPRMWHPGRSRASNNIVQWDCCGRYFTETGCSVYQR